MLDPIASRLENYMDLLAARQKLVASNVANIDTPGYRTRDIDFQFEYMSHVDGTGLDVIEPDGLTVKNDGNNVSLDRESRLMAENALRFSMASTLLRGEIQTMKRAIDEGKSS